MRPDALRVIVVDDDELVLKTIGIMLERLGYPSYQLFSSGLAAMDALTGTANLPHVILLDISMPGIDGVELIGRLEKMKFAGDVIIVSCGGELTLKAAQQLAKGSRISVTGALAKPVMPQQLSQLLEVSIAKLS